MRLTSDQFDKLALEQLDTLYRVAMRLTREPARAEDLVQETFVRACGARDRFDLQQYGIRPWLVRIMNNLHINRSIREQREAVATEDEQLEASAQCPSPPPWMGNAGLEGMDQRLVHALDQLSEQCRVVMMLWAMEDFSQNEIAAALDIPVGTVMSRLHRARKQLAAKLADFVAQERMIGQRN